MQIKTKQSHQHKSYYQARIFHTTGQLSIGLTLQRDKICKLPINVHKIQILLQLLYVCSISRPLKYTEQLLCLYLISAQQSIKDKCTRRLYRLYSIHLSNSSMYFNFQLSLKAFKWWQSPFTTSKMIFLTCRVPFSLSLCRLVINLSTYYCM